MLELTKSIEDVVQQCKECGRGSLVKKDKGGYTILHLEAEWEPYPDGVHDVIVLYICYNDTGRVAYSTYILESMVER